MISWADYQLADVLMLAANLAPVALYFLVLGLVNSHDRPYLITSRADFTLLTCALFPLLLWPVPGFVRAGQWWVLVMGVCLAAATFFRLLPGHRAGFVIYNVSEGRCRRLLGDALRASGLSGGWDGSVWRSDCGRIAVHASGFSLLRNVTLHFEVRGSADPRIVDAVGRELDRRLTASCQLPSAMGACLVWIGVCLMIVPMWMVGRHIDDLVDAMTGLFG